MDRRMFLSIMGILIVGGIFGLGFMGGREDAPLKEAMHYRKLDTR